MAGRMVVARFIFIPVLSKNPPPCFGGLLFFEEGNFSDGDLIYRKEPGRSGIFSPFAGQWISEFQLIS